MKKAIIGILIGIVLTLIAMINLVPRNMVSEQPSRLGYEETISHIHQAVTNAGWKVSALMRLDKTLAKEGKTVLPAASFKICQPDYAETILLDDEARFLTVMMPCSIAVYQKQDGLTYISSMNTQLMGYLFGGTVKDIMAGPVARETAEFIPVESK